MAALAPLVVAILPGPRIPQVVIFLLGGVLIGPHVLGLASTASIRLLANVGLGFLFLLAGVRARSGAASPARRASWRSAAGGARRLAGRRRRRPRWRSTGFIHDFVPIGLALTTTALGTLLPILKDNDLLAGPFGRYVLAAGAAGELLPILVISLFLTQHGEFSAVASILVVLFAGLLPSAVIPRVAGKDRLRAMVRQGQHSPPRQTTLRWTIVLLLVLLMIASRLRPGRGARRADGGHRAAGWTSLDRTWTLTAA